MRWSAVILVLTGLALAGAVGCSKDSSPTETVVDETYKPTVDPADSVAGIGSPLDAEKTEDGDDSMDVDSVDDDSVDANSEDDDSEDDDSEDELVDIQTE